MASVDKRPNGQWRARWREYPGGPQKAQHFAKKADADRHLVKMQHDLLTGAYVDPSKSRTTLGDFYRLWSARQPWRASSRASVTSLFENHVLPTFESRPLGTIRRGDVETWAAGLSLAGTTARLAVQYLSTLFEAAIGDGLLSSNPARNAKRPSVDTAPVVPLTLEELEDLGTAAPEWFRVAMTLGAAVGLRQSEATGLTVDRIDFLRRSLTVDRQLVTPAAGDPELGPPKTSRSYRTIPLADVAVEGIARHVEQFGTGRDGLLLHEEGRPVRRQRFGQTWRYLRARAAKAVDVEDVEDEDRVAAERLRERLASARFHDCRHTYASTLLSGGVSVAAAAEYLGHSPAVLLRTYAHLIPADHERARAVVQAAFAADAEPAEDSLRTAAAE